MIKKESGNRMTQKEKMQKYVSQMTERAKIYDTSKEKNELGYEKIEKFIEVYTKDYSEEQKEIIKKIILEGYVIYKTILYLNELGYSNTSKINLWLEENKNFIDSIKSYESQTKDPYGNIELSAYYTVGSPIADIFDKNLINGIFRPDLFGTARNDLNEVKEIIELILLKRKIDSLDDTTLRTLYYDITNTYENAEIKYLETELTSISSRYKKDAVFEDSDYLNDPYYKTLLERLNSIKQQRQQTIDLIAQLPAEEIREKMYTMLSDGKEDYERAKKGQVAKTKLEEAGYDVTNLDKEIQITAARLYILGINTPDNNDVVIPNLNTIMNAYDYFKRSKESHDEYEKLLIKTKVFGLTNSLKEYLELFEVFEADQAKKDSIDSSLSDARDAKNQYDSMSRITQIVTRLGKTLKEESEKIESLESESNLYGAVQKDRVEVLAQKLTKVQDDLRAFGEDYKSRLEYPTKYNVITDFVKTIMEIKDEDFESSLMIKTILEGTSPTTLVSQAIRRLGEKINGDRNDIFDYLSGCKESDKEGIEEVESEFAETIEFFPSFKEKGITIGTITANDIKEEQERQLAHYELLCAAKYANSDRLIDKATDLITSDEATDSRETSQVAMGDQAFDTKVEECKIKQYGKRQQKNNQNKDA